MPVRKNVARHSNASASRGIRKPESIVPRSAAKTFCMMPAFTPRRCGEDSTFMIERHTGRNGPSASPMTTRASSRDTKPVATPESAEHSENKMIEPSTKGLRTPTRSDHAPTKYAESAQANDNPEPSQPSCSLLSPSSATISAARKLIVFRSKNTRPKLVPSRSKIPFS
jgi:hypothetical protein